MGVFRLAIWKDGVRDHQRGYRATRVQSEEGEQQRPGALLDLLDQERAVADLEAVIARRIAADPFALDNADPGIAAAIKTAYDAVWGVSSSSVKRLSAVAIGRATPSDDFALLLVEPSGEQSGVEVVQGQAERTIVATNHKRKPCQVLTYRTGVEDAAKVRTNYPKAIRLGDPVDLPSTTGLNPLSNLANLRSGQTAFVPVSTAPITLTLAGGSSKTFYDTIVLMASGDIGAAEPSYFSDARYAVEVDGWRETLGQLNLGVLLELLIGAVTAVLGGAALTISVARIKAFEAAMTAIGETSVVDLLAKGRHGALTLSVKGFLDIAARSDSLGKRLRSELLHILPEVERVAELDASALIRPTFWIATRLFAIVNLALGIGDIAAVVADQVSSNKAERWTETLAKPTIDLTPLATTIGKGGKVRFTATVAGAAGQTLLYIWETGSLLTSLTDNAGQTGSQISTKTGTVDLITQNTASGTITVSVTAYVIGVNGNSKVGSAQATVTIDDKKQVVYGRFFVDETQQTIGKGIAASIAVPRVAKATAYRVHCYGFNDPAAYGTEINVSWTEPNRPSYFTDRGSEFVWGIAGTANVQPDDEAGWVAYYTGRFQGMIVEVTVSF